MKLSARLLVGIVGSLLIAACFASQAAAEPLAKGKPKLSLKVDKGDRGQRAILKRGIEVQLKLRTAKRAKLRATSTTFDAKKRKRIARPVRFRVAKADRVPGSKRAAPRVFLRMRLNKSGKGAVRSCEARRIIVRGGGDQVKFKLVRDTDECAPKSIDLSRADTCDFIGNQDQSLCMVPFPDDYYTREDSTSATGRRIDFATAGMPANVNGVNIDGEPYNHNDGFSPGSAIVVRAPGLNTAADVAANNVPRLAQLGSYADERSRIVAIDTATGERHPIWAEIDSNSDDPARTALLIHPSRNFESGHRYVIAMRKLETASGEALEAPEGFRYYRDDLPTKEPAIKAQRKRFESIFRVLRRADIKRRSLYLAWDFTVASDENIAGRLLHMRDESFAELGDTNLADGVAQGTAPAFGIDTIDNFTPVENETMARRVRGSFTAPCYMTPNCEPGGRFVLGADGLPSVTGTYQANFDCMIPRSAVDGTPAPARPAVYGHGLLGSAGEVTSAPQRSLGNNFNIVSCATDEIGLSTGDIGNAVQILSQLGKFPEAADRLQQGLLNELLLGRLMIRPDGFASSGAFHVDGTLGTAGVIDPAKLYYNGNSQGGIMGGAFMAVSPDATRGTLGVPGMNYSVLLNRSVDFDEYANIAMFPSYPDRLARPLVLSMIQMLWDRGEANGYAHRMTDDPLPNTPQPRGPAQRRLRRPSGDQLDGRQRGAHDRRLGARPDRRRRPLAGR